MSRWNICCCNVQEHLTLHDAEQYLSWTGPESLRRWTDLVKTYVEEEDIANIRHIFQTSQIPYRVQKCAQGINTCCGLCTRSCTTRCTQDILHRAYTYQQEFGPDWDQWPTIYRVFYLSICPPQGIPQYSQVCKSLSQIIGMQYNPHLKKALKEFGGNNRIEMSESHPHRWDYGPRYIYDDTGYPVALEWPASGLCPFCVSPIPARRKRKLSV